MGMGEDEAMTYRLGGGPLWYACWTLLDDSKKVEARGTMRRVTQDYSDWGLKEMKKRAAKMVLGPNGHQLYKLGHGRMYYAIWDILTDVEQDEARLKMKATVFACIGGGSLTTAENASLEAQYICAEKMNAVHELFIHPAFYSHRLHHAVCGAPFAILKRREKDGWRHA